jgi:hypothetical protein
MLKRSKVEMTACSGLFDPVSKSDSGSLPWSRSDSALKVLEGEVLDNHRRSIGELSREERHGECAICRKLTQQDLG